MAELEDFLADIADPANGIAPETQALIKPVAKETDDIYGSVTGATLMSVAVNFPFAKETQTMINGVASILETLAPEPEPEPEPEG